MSDFIFSDDEIKKFVIANLPDYQSNMIISLLSEEIIDDQKIDILGEKLTGEHDEQSMIINVGAKRKKNSFWVNVKKEVYKAICTDSKEYAKEREIVGNGFESLVGTIAGILVAQFNLAAGLATGLSTVVLIGVAKIGKNAWCSTNIDLK